MAESSCHCPVAKTISASKNKIMTVRINVAMSELMSDTPILAKKAVSAANTADRNAQLCQVIKLELIITASVDLPPSPPLNRGFQTSSQRLHRRSCRTHRKAATLQPR